MSYQSIRQERLAKQAFLKLLEIKETDIRLLTLFQAKTAVDRGIHIGGAFSAIIPLTALYYGGVMNYDVEQPTRSGQDLFILSKGHAVAALASIYADLGYFPESYLKNSRSLSSLLNGHPGPLLPGILTATGPLGEGIGVAQGLALAARCGKAFDVFAMTGDGELQEGLPWEAIMYAGAKRLDNLCVLVDKNGGQLDNSKALHYPMDRLDDAFESFGWNVFSVDATKHEPVFDALVDFKFGSRNGRPTVIICYSRKGQGGFSSFMNAHKVELSEALADQETRNHEMLRETRVADLNNIIASASDEEVAALRSYVSASAKKMGFVFTDDKSGFSVKASKLTVKTKPAKPRDKKISYDPSSLPVLEAGKKYSAQEVITGAMKVFALDGRIVSVDSDLGSTSGLEGGVSWVDINRGLNAGIAEANMMNIGEAFAALGFNAWVSTFAPFFNWQVLRRIAVSYQERQEAMAREDGWITKGHGLDLTFLATAPNLETKTNGATHMGNDDIMVYDGIAHLKIIDVSCPQLLQSIMKWIMEGNRGLVYLRILRGSVPAIYANDFKFEYGKAYYVSEPQGAQVYIVSSGHGVYEALSAAKLLKENGVEAAVVDMPSFDPVLAEEIHDSGKKIVIAEQNNGYILSKFRKALFGKKGLKAENLIPINLLDKEGNPRFLHSATYDELLESNGLSPKQIADKAAKALKSQ
jgi:transketolase N-terminal domain/subunit/transketolase C-terminal domain/subunit